MLPKVTSLFDLLNKAKTNKRYERIVILAAKNLGGSEKTFAEAVELLNSVAKGDGSCKGVVEEANYCRELIEDEDYVAQFNPKPIKKFKVIKSRDVIDSNNYIRVQYTGPSYVYSDALQSFDRLQREAQETGQTIMVAQQQPASSEFLPIADDFVLDDFSLVSQPTDPIQSTPSNSIVDRWPESPYRA